MFRPHIALLTSAAAALLATVAVTPAGAQVVSLGPTITQYGPPDLVPTVTSSKSTILAGPYSGGGVTETVIFTITVENRTTVVATNPLTGAKQVAGSDQAGVSFDVYLGPNLRQGGGIIASGGFSCWPDKNGHLVHCANGYIAAGFNAEVQIEAFADRISNPCWEWNHAKVNVDPANTIGEVNELNNQATGVVTVTTMC